MVKYSKYIVMLIFIMRVVIIKYNQVYDQILSGFLWMYTFIFRKRLEYINGISPINFWGGSLPLVTAWICGCHLLTYWAHRVQQPEVLSHGLLILIKSAISHAFNERVHVVWTQTTIEISIFHSTLRITNFQMLFKSHLWSFLKLGFGILPCR